MYNYRNDLRQQEAAGELAAYQRLLAHFHELHFAGSEGVFEVTIRSQSHTVTLPVAFGVGRQIACDLSDQLESRIVLLEADLNMTVENAGDDARHDRKAAERRIHQHEQDIRVVQQQLAQQAQPTFNTKAPVGRPRKAAKPSPEVMEAVGELAAQVPMNGSTGHAVARATNLPSA